MMDLDPHMETDLVSPKINNTPQVPAAKMEMT